MRPMLLTALLTALITMAISCKKEEKFNTSDEANGAETAALVESAADVDTMAEESIEVVAELITSATDPLAEQTLFAQAIESVDTSFMSALDQNAIIEAVFAKLDTNSDRQISLTEVSGAIETVAADFGTVDQTKLAQITQFVFPDSSKSHHLDTVKPRISALLNHQKVFKLRARKRMVSHGDIICRRGKTHRSSTLGLVSAKDSGACVRRPYREVSHYAMPFPRTQSFRAAMRRTRSKPNMQKYFLSLQDSMVSLRLKMDEICASNENSTQVDANTTKMCNLRRLHAKSPHFGGAWRTTAPAPEGSTEETTEEPVAQ